MAADRCADARAGESMTRRSGDRRADDVAFVAVASDDSLAVGRRRRRNFRITTPFTATCRRR